MKKPWRRDLQEAITDGAKAYAYLGKEPPKGVDFAAIGRQYSIRIPKYYLDLIDKRDPYDPIGLQCLPQGLEMGASELDIPDAVGDAKRSPVPGIVHKYPNRVILLVANTCSMYCRYCFRKPVPKGIALPGLREGLEQAFAYIQAQRGIEEVIFSGGDPLILGLETLLPLIERLQAMDHIRMIRIHSRVPVTLPQRIDDALVDALAAHKPITVVTHFNHPRELSPLALTAIDRFTQRGIPLLNQAVLLRGVNDKSETLARLFGDLYYLGVRPYYLHHCDRTPGTAPFRTSLQAGMDLMASLKNRLSGPALPRYVLDIPGGYGKYPISRHHFTPLDAHRWQITLPTGKTLIYQDISSDNQPDLPRLF